jgi:hypothetical protein
MAPKFGIVRRQGRANVTKETSKGSALEIVGGLLMEQVLVQRSERKSRPDQPIARPMLAGIGVPFVTTWAGPTAEE